MDLGLELERIAAAASGHARPDESLAGVIPAEPRPGYPIFLCAFDGADRTWLALDADAEPVCDRALVREAVSIAAMCELAEESAGGGNLTELQAELAELRRAEELEGIDEAEAAARALERTIGTPPRMATPGFLDAVGTATRRLEEALGQGPGSPFAEAMKQASALAGELEREVVAGYRTPLE